MSASNYPDGMTRRDYDHVEGISRCVDCGAVLPEDRECERCGGSGKEAYRYAGEPDGHATCTECDGAGRIPVDGDVCPGGCPEKDWDEERDRRDEETLEERYGP